jgi:hypothetical protein
MMKMPQKIKILKQESSIISCTVDTIGVILSTNLLSKTGFKSCCSEGTWNGLITPSHFVHLEELDSKEFDVMECMFHIQLKDKIFGGDRLKSFLTEILDAKYKITDVAEVMKGLTHLDAYQKQTCLECYRKTKRF